MKWKKKLQYSLEPLKGKSLPELVRLAKWESIYDYVIFLISFPLVINFFSGVESEGLSTGFIMKNAFVYFCIAAGLRGWLKSDHKLMSTFSLDSVQGMCLFIMLSFAVFYPFMLLLSQRETLPLFVPVLHGLMTALLLLIPRLFQQLQYWQQDKHGKSDAIPCLFMLDSKLALEVFTNWSVYESEGYSIAAAGKLDDTTLDVETDLPLLNLDNMNEFIAELQLLEQVPQRVIIDPRAYDASFIRRLFKQLGSIGVNTLKLHEDPVNGTMSIKSLSSYDLLANFDTFAYSASYADKAVAVYVSSTELSGSLVGFLAHSGAKEIVLLGTHQHSLDMAEDKLRNSDWNGNTHSYLIDNYGTEQLQQTLRKHNLDYLFHAAGTEGLRFAQQNPQHAYKYNLWLNHILCQAAISCKISHVFYLDIGASSDGHMPALRTAIHSHILSQNEAQLRTKFYVVDMYGYGNSSSQMLAKILDEVEHGGPVHLPHKEHMQVLSNPDHMFCTLSNVMNLPARKDRIYVLEGGKPLRLYDLVEDAILLKGLKPKLDIEIVFTGAQEQSPLFSAMHSVHGQSSIPGVDNIFFRPHKTPDYGLVQKVMSNFGKYLATDNLAAMEKAVHDLCPEKINHKQETAA